MKKNLLLSLLSLLLLSIIVTTILPCRPQPQEIKIISTNLSQRVVLLDTVETRLNLMIGFKISDKLPWQPEELNVLGRLFFHNKEVATCHIPKLDFYGGNLNFYLPYNISPGNYDLHIEIRQRSSGPVITAQNFTIKNIETLSARETGPKKNWMQPQPIPLQNHPAEPLGAEATATDIARGFILWHRNPFKYVYPNSAPKQGDTITAVAVRLARNEFEPATFSLYALENLGKVTIAVSLLTGPGATPLPPPEIHTVKTVPRIISRESPLRTYELRPRLLKKQNQNCGDWTLIIDGFPIIKYPVPIITRSQRFWLTLHANADKAPGTYRGNIIITTNRGQTKIPIHVEVLPFTLQERPDKEYGFAMTYEFQEMTARDLSDKERQKVYENGLKYYQSFKEHGLTTIFPHSPFTFQRMPDESPDLRDLEAALKAFVKVGFSGPFIYYCGHLVQNSKPGWAGSTLNFDAKRHPRLMKEIITYARNNFPEMDAVDFYWMPGDEIQDDSGGPNRMKITASLLQPLWKMHEKTALTIWDDISWPIDIQFGSPNPAAAAYWHYPNKLTTVPDNVDDATSIRREFGLKHISSNFIGITPWTFQTTENAAGSPYTDLDNTGGPEVMIAYPGLDGPISTPEYEAVREGIDDGRYAYLLETLIEKARRSPNNSTKNLGLQAETAYREILAASGNASLEEMDTNRQTIINWILQLSK